MEQGRRGMGIVSGQRGRGQEAEWGGRGQLSVVMTNSGILCSFPLPPHLGIETHRRSRVFPQEKGTKVPLPLGDLHGRAPTIRCRVRSVGLAASVEKVALIGVGAF